ncbi:MAG: hypothetical protein AAF236_17205 [Verrucomicrobiota bacterium]
MRLITSSGELEVIESGDGFLQLKVPASISPGQAQFKLWIDDELFESTINLAGAIDSDYIEVLPIEAPIPAMA